MLGKIIEPDRRFLFKVTKNVSGSHGAVKTWSGAAAACLVNQGRKIIDR